MCQDIPPPLTSSQDLEVRSVQGYSPRNLLTVVAVSPKVPKKLPPLPQQENFASQPSPLHPAVQQLSHTCSYGARPARNPVNLISTRRRPQKFTAGEQPRPGDAEESNRWNIVPRLTIKPPPHIADHRMAPSIQLIASQKLTPITAMFRGDDQSTPWLQSMMPETGVEGHMDAVSPSPPLSQQI